MNKVVYGLLLGGVLGIFDGLTAWFTPAVRNELVGIVIGSTMKGAVAGLAAGVFAKKVDSLPLGIAFGLAVGLFLAYLVAAAGASDGQHYYVQIMVPGSLVGALAGFATQRHSPAKSV